MKKINLILSSTILLLISFITFNSTIVSASSTFTLSLPQSNACYEITNTTNSEIFIRSTNNNIMSYAIYDKNGNWYSAALRLTGGVYLNPGDTVRISSFSSTVTLNIPSSLSNSYRYIAEPVLYSFTTDNKSSVYIENTSNNNLYCYSETNQKFNLAIGSSSTYTRENINLCDKIGSGSYFLISSASTSNSTFYVPYPNRVYAKKLSTPLYYTVTITKGESLEIYTDKNFNSSPLISTTLNPNTSYDLVSYNTSSSLADSITKNSTDNPRISTFSSTSKNHITILNGEGITFKTPYVFKDNFKITTKPALTKLSVPVNKLLRYSNKPTSKKVAVAYNSDLDSNFTYDSIEYKSDGNIFSYSQNTTTKISYFDLFSANYSIEISPIDKPIAMYIPSDYGSRFEVLDSTLFSTIVIEPQKSIEYKLNPNIRNSLSYSSNNIVSDNIFHDLLTYNDSNELQSYEYSTTKYLDLYTNFKLTNTSNKNLIIKTPRICSDSFKTSTPCFFKTTLTKGQGIELANYNSNSLFKYEKPSTSGVYLDTIRYNTTFTDIIDFQRSSSTLLSFYDGDSYKISNKGVNVNISILYDYKDSLKVKPMGDLVIYTKLKANTKYKLNFGLYKKVLIKSLYSNKNPIYYTGYNELGLPVSSSNFLVSGEISSNYYSEIYVENTDTTVLVLDDPKNFITQIEDINSDLKVDILDLSAIATKYNTDSSSKNYKIDFDLNKSQNIDLYDITIVAKAIN